MKPARIQDPTDSAPPPTTVRLVAVLPSINSPDTRKQPASLFKRTDQSDTGPSLRRARIAPMNRQAHRYARNGALAALGLYTIVILVVTALTAGFDGARRAPVDNVDRSGLFERFNQAVPVALQGLQDVLTPHS